MPLFKSMRWLLLSLLAGNGVQAAEVLAFDSGVAQTRLIELYTSEGCSSCPPAEAWLNSQTQQAELWKTLIPVAFHVDYWDYLGWKDRFARAEYSARQRRYAGLQRVRTVYTPAFIVNGVGWRRGWFDKTVPTAGKSVGRLQVQVDDDAVVQARFEPLQPVAEPLQLHLALLGMGLSTQIKAGENRGRHAQHDFVVLALQSVSGTGANWRTRLPRASAPGASGYALAAWVSAADDPSPLQATGGFLPSALLTDN